MIVEYIAARLDEREALAQAAAHISEWDDGWSDLPVDVYEHAQAHDRAWAVADIRGLGDGWQPSAACGALRAANVTEPGPRRIGNRAPGQVRGYSPTLLAA